MTQVPHDLAEVIITAQPKVGGGIQWTIRYRPLGELALIPLAAERFDGSRLVPNAVIRIIDETGTLPPILFEHPIPTEMLNSLMDALTFWAGRASLSADIQNKMAPLFGAFDHARANNAGIRFTLGTAAQLPGDALMGVAMNATTRQPTVRNGYFTIYVNPNAANPRSFGSALDLVLFHELMHINPNYDADVRARFTRRGIFIVNAYNRNHQDTFYDRAGRMLRIIKRNLSSLGPTNLLIGEDGNDVLVGNSLDNQLHGLDGNNTFTATGLFDYLYGGAGDDRYIFATNSEAYVIEDDGGNNVLEVQGAYTTANIRLGTVGRFLLIGVVSDPNSLETAYDLNRVVMIPTDNVTGPAVQTIEIGGVAYSLPSLTPLNNSRPELIEPLRFKIPLSQFGSGHIGYIVAVDRESDPLTLTVESVTGLGEEESWTLVGNQLRTSFTNFNQQRGRSYVTIKASDGRAADVKTYEIIWEGRLRG